MGTRSTTRSNTMFAIIATFSTTLCLATILITIARTSTPEQVGRFSYALSAVAPIFILASLRLRDIQATDVTGVYEPGDYFMATIAASSLGIIATLPVCFSLGMDRSTCILALLIALWRASALLSEVVFGLHQGLGDMRSVAKLQCIHAVGALATFPLLYFLASDLNVAIGALVLVRLAIFFIVDVRSMRVHLANRLTSDQSLDWCRALALIRIGLPLGVAGAIFGLTPVIPRALLEMHFGFEMVGIFSAIAVFSKVGTVFMQAFGQAVSSRLAFHFYSDNKIALSRFVSRSAVIPLALGGVLTFFAWFAGPPVVAMVFGSQYTVEPIAASLTVLYSTFAATSTLLAYGLITSRFTKSHLGIIVATVISTFLIGCVTIPAHGVTGACVALAVSAGLRLLLTVAANFRMISLLNPDNRLAVSEAATTG